MAVAIAVLLFADLLRFEHAFLSAMVQGSLGIAVLAEAVGPQLALSATGLGMVVLALGLLTLGGRSGRSTSRVCHPSSGCAGGPRVAGPRGAPSALPTSRQ